MSSLQEELSELQQLVNDFVKETETINQDFVSTVSKINTEFRSVDSIFSKHRRCARTLKDLQSSLTELEKEHGLSNANDDALQQVLALRDTLATTKQVVDNLGKSKRKTGSLFVSLIMGKVSVRIWNEGDRFKFKSEYNRFKERWLVMFFVFPALQILYGYSVLVNQLQSTCFLYYYASLAIRENILSLNGSSIESWWIYHHYWSMVVSLLTLLLYTGDGMSDGNYLNYFSLYQGAVMTLQNNYQRKRHYARKAMAKKGALDIRTSEVIDETPHAQYKVLIPALYLTYFMQLLIGIYFLFLSSDESIRENALKCLQVIAMSVCWVVLSIGNCATLSKVLNRKKNASKTKKKKE
mmetsp:Transcript_55572/g.92399  ORF Transcript_55572/g.92399 Transcript_55572/m.92399 type:complete len:353 (-) Transcript_55572:93-1151(-)